MAEGTLNIFWNKPWPATAQLYEPDEVGEMLLPDLACCLSARTVLAMQGLPFQVQIRNNVDYISPSGKLPLLKVDQVLVSELSPMIEYLECRGHVMNKELDDIERGEAQAYIALIEHTLYNAQLYHTWAEKQVYDEVTYAKCARNYSWPLNRLLPRQKRNAALALLKASNWHSKSFEEVCIEVERCCRALSEKLGDKKYFFGDNPTELDAIAFGHLQCILTTKLPVRGLHNLFNTFPNIKKFCERIDTEFMH